MSDSNVGFGMAPCRKGCRCDECTIERLTAENERLLAEVNFIIRGLLRGPHTNEAERRAAKWLQEKDDE